MDIIKNASADFDSMISLAKDNLPKASDCEFVQCVVVNTVIGNLLIHKIEVNSVEELINEQCRIVSELEKSSDTAVEKIICMWNNEALEVPSRGFMQSLCKSNVKNMNARVALNTGSGPRIKVTEIVNIIGRI